MPKKPNTSADPAKLRRRAEARLSDQQKDQPSKAGDQKSAADTARALHELEVHQIELEMQNAELQKVREELEATLEKYTDLYDFAPVAYLTLDREGTIRETNLAGASLLGTARAALVKRRFGPYVSPADRPLFDSFLRQVFERGTRQECDVRVVTEGKPLVDVRMRANVFESGQTCRVAVTDISEHKRAEADQLIMNKLESTGILAGGIAHDFNNLLTVILLDLELIQMLNPPGEELVRHLEEAKQTSLQARRLTAQLVTFAEGGAPIRRAMFLPGLIEESVRPALSGSNVRCVFTLAKDLWGAEVDATQMGQVFRNLVLNAREAMPPGGVVSVRAENVVLGLHEIQSLPAGEYVRVSIADQGVGIAKDVLPKIFDPYFSMKERGNQKGMGLGLTICHTVVQKHDGAITVESEVGVGTTFHIYLPATRELSSKVQAPLPAVDLQLGRVLVMDDKEGVRKAVGQTLRGLGHDVELAEDGQQAIEIYQQAKRLGLAFDVVILDVTVRGGMGAQETILALRKVDPAVKAVAMSGHLRDPVMLEPERHGFNGTLAKPFEVEKLEEVLSKVMGS